jgi:hypothetical protein
MQVSKIDMFHAMRSAHPQLGLRYDDYALEISNSMVFADIKPEEFPPDLIQLKHTSSTRITYNNY